MATFIIGGIVLALMILAGVKVVRDRKKGGCGCGCSGCPSAQHCHK